MRKGTDIKRHGDCRLVLTIPAFESETSSNHHFRLLRIKSAFVIKQSNIGLLFMVCKATCVISPSITCGIIFPLAYSS